MKRFIAFVLVMVLTVSAMSICIFAASNSQTGVYKGKTYRAYVHCSDTTAKASMSWEGTQYTVMAKVGIDYHVRDTYFDGESWKTSSPKKGFSDTSVSVPSGAVADRGHCFGFIDDIPFVSDIKAYPGR